MDNCKNCPVPDNPRFYDIESEEYFTCSMCACYSGCGVVSEKESCPHYIKGDFKDRIGLRKTEAAQYGNE